MKLLTENLLLKLMSIISLMLSFSVSALPGDILFSDNFERTNIAPNWTTTNATLSAIGNHTSNSSSRSLYTRHSAVTTTSSTVNLLGKYAKIELWIRRGSDAFSEEPDNSENIIIEYLTNSNSWSQLKTYLGNGTPGQIYLLDEQLPANALHNDFRIRVRQTGGSGSDYDYWHIDDVVITETGYVPPPPPLELGGCENFEGDLNNWTLNLNGGAISTNSATAQSPSNSLDIYAGVASATSLSINTTNNFKEVTIWVRRGNDTFSENPDKNENFLVEYLNASGSWVVLETFLGSGTAGQIYNRTYTMPADAKHAAFRLRLRMLSASGSNYDHWHIDDVCLVKQDMPSMKLTKTSQVISDPINLTNNPKRIPGAIIRYTIRAENSQSTVGESVTITDTLNAVISSGKINWVGNIIINSPNTNGGSATALSDATDADVGEFSGNNLTVRCGNINNTAPCIVRYDVEVNQ